MEKPQLTDAAPVAAALLAQAWRDAGCREHLERRGLRIPASPIGDLRLQSLGFERPELHAGTVAATCSTVAASCSTVAASCSTVAASCSSVSANCSTVAATCSTVSAKC